MKKRTAVIGALVSLLPMGLSLVVRIAAVLTSASVMLAVPVKAQAESAESYYELGLDYLWSEDYYESISAFNKAIEIEPKGGYLYYRRARAKYLLRDYEGSLRDYKRAIDFGLSIVPQSGGVFSNLTCIENLKAISEIVITKKEERKRIMVQQRANDLI